MAHGALQEQPVGKLATILDGARIQTARPLNAVGLAEKAEVRIRRKAFVLMFDIAGQVMMRLK
jgi:hypothetical protein